MYSDGNSFFKRANILRAELKKRSFPNATTLADILSCSKSTVRRTIHRLQQDFAWPIAYDEEAHGYYFTRANFESPLLTPGKDELTALLLLKDLAGVLDVKDLQDKIDTLWCQYVAHNPALTAAPAELAKYFSSDSTIVGTLSDFGVLELLEYAHRQCGVELTYRSPWRAREDKAYRGKIQRLHFSDGNLYVLFNSDDNRQIVLNACFLKTIRELDFDPLLGKNIPNDINWPHGFGVWHGEDIHEVEIRIKAPGSFYFASQVWHESQEDVWDGDILIRRLKSALSRQLVSRIVSLGALVSHISPDPLRQMVLKEANQLIESLSCTSS